MSKDGLEKNSYVATTGLNYTRLNLACLTTMVESAKLSHLTQLNPLAVLSLTRQKVGQVGRNADVALSA